eukprot:TRINITY_DN15774_c0_g1_i3.p1 TRINITY_DN15774_c0_g1~~TRINITY_DN15774_c0_g1_i3.p1  ORF type:complete len:319 (+),score=63.76 TRINITY_DN15774_c0_g1_i3:406-1362(+)
MPEVEPDPQPRRGRRKTVTFPDGADIIVPPEADPPLPDPDPAPFSGSFARTHSSRSMSSVQSSARSARTASSYRTASSAYAAEGYSDVPYPETPITPAVHPEPPPRSYRRRRKRGRLPPPIPPRQQVVEVVDEISDSGSSLGEPVPEHQRPATYWSQVPPPQADASTAFSSFHRSLEPSDHGKLAGVSAPSGVSTTYSLGGGRVPPHHSVAVGEGAASLPEHLAYTTPPGGYTLLPSAELADAGAGRPDLAAPPPHANWTLPKGAAVSDGRWPQHAQHRDAAAAEWGWQNREVLGGGAVGAGRFEDRRKELFRGWDVL